MPTLVRLLTITSLSASLAVASGVPAGASAGALPADVAVSTPQVQELDLSGVDVEELRELPPQAPLPAEDVAPEALASSGVSGQPAAEPDAGPGTGAEPDAGPGAGGEPSAEPGADQPEEDARRSGGRSATDAATDAATDGATPSATPGDAPVAAAVPTTPPAVLTPELEVEPFSVFGVSWDVTDDLEDVVVRYRLRSDGRWSDWEAVGASDVAPDADGAEGGAPSRGASDAVVAPDADGIQVWADAERGTVAGLKVVLIDPGPDPAANATGAALRTAVAAPGIVTRAQWGADESLVTCSPDYSRDVRAAAVHHTASSNSYSAADVPGILRGILAYHTRPESGGGRGWCDIGYNFLVDKWGRVFEGRSGGMDRPVVGVHTGGFNSRTFGVAAIGEYGSTTAPVAMTEAISQVIAWKFAVHRISASASVTLVSGGGASKYPAGTAVTFPTVFGHRDAQYTSCPGQTLYAALGAIRNRVAVLADGTVAASPFGSWDSVDARGGAVTVSGWAAEPGSTAPVSVRVDVGGTTRTVVADLHRPDVGAAHPGEGPLHGFRVRVPAPNGRHAVCVTALNVGPGHDVNLGCTWSQVQNATPVGSLDAVTTTATAVAVRGWAFDPDTSDPVRVHVYLDGAPVRSITADGSRPDVAQAFGVGPNHGFAGSVRTTPGVHQVCLYLINVPEGHNPQLACRTVQVGHPPVGALDAVVTTPSTIGVRGWAFDRDTTDPVRVHVYVDGSPVRSLRADGSRPDVARAHGVGERHGFSGTVPATAGRHEVCLYLIDVPTGPNPLLGCRTVTVRNAPPVGAWDALEGTAGDVSVRGWGFDPDTTAPIRVHVYVDGSPVRSLTADRSRPDVARVHGVGDRHGFSGTVAAPPGRHEVCLYLIDVPGGPNPSLGCRVTTVG
ncbi:N-acetylmuramoyl-L-alanine amidase [Cellulomonas telluris]|uniref:N-acetylmuramoyl-L-alanine amidase n=1 Tax=Cellulomonas telluris TaxID=2306636 RepID=UPI0010A81F24|nr:N-acetylmuramoyl-L-alanine amidase [Cellulomonas telluris]